MYTKYLLAALVVVLALTSCGNDYKDLLQGDWAARKNGPIVLTIEGDSLAYPGDKLKKYHFAVSGDKFSTEFSSNKIVNINTDSLVLEDMTNTTEKDTIPVKTILYKVK